VGCAPGNPRLEGGGEHRIIGLDVELKLLSSVAGGPNPGHQIPQHSD